MSVYRHKKSPYWQFEFQIDGDRFSGSTKVSVADPKHKAEEIEAEEKRKARELVEHLAAGAGKPLGLKAACDRWWNEHGRDLNEASAEKTLAWIAETIGPKTLLHAITDDAVSRLVQARRLHVKRAGVDEDGRQLYRPISNATVNKTVDLLRRVMRRARDNWNAPILREPVWKNHKLKEKRHHVRELRPSEETTLDQVEDADFRDVRRFAIITGLRRGNLLLKKSQVNFELGQITIIAKGGVPRILPLTAEAYAILWRRRDGPTEYVFTFKAQRTRKCPKTGALFVKGQRYPITYYGLGSNKRKWMKAGVDARIHDLRHTTGMRVLRKTGNLKAVQKILFHTDIAITAKFYTDATIDDMRAAMEAGSAPAIEHDAPKLLEHKKEGET